MSKDLNQIITESVDKVQRRLLDRLDDIGTTYPSISGDVEGFKELVNAKGKLIRPRFLFVAYKLCNGQDENKLIDISSALEMYHNNSLIFDDIQDKAKLRRKQSAHHIKYGISSTLSLCALLSRKVTDVVLGSELDSDIKEAVLKRFNDAQLEVSAGQLEEVNLLRDDKIDITLDDYFKIIKGKTASLFSYAFEIGAYLAKPNMHSKLKEDMCEMGTQVGYLFQIVDDYIDLFAHTEKFGKPKYQDIKEGKRTLFLIHTRNNLGGKEREVLDEIYLKPKREDEDIEKVLNYMGKTGAQKMGQSIVQNLKEDIIARIDEITEEYGLNADYADYLRTYVDMLSKRTV